MFDYKSIIESTSAAFNKGAITGIQEKLNGLLTEQTVSGKE